MAENINIVLKQGNDKLNALGKDKEKEKI